MKDIEAFFCSDIHLSLKPPICRSDESDWLVTQARYLSELRDLSDGGRIPIICAGDIFDRHSPPPELINFAIDNLPFMWAVPGNHDLICGRYEDLHKSAYWTLAQAGKITDLSPGSEYGVRGSMLSLHGFPWGAPHKSRTGRIVKSALVRDIAVVHEYVWTRNTGHHEAKEEQRLGAFRQRMGTAFDLVVVGDNHQSFYAHKGSPVVLNCGAFMRRSLAEVDHRPAVWALKSDGSIEPHYLDVSKDVVSDAHRVAEKLRDPKTAERLIRELKDDEVAFLSFEEAMTRHLTASTGLTKRVRNNVLEIMEAIRKT